MSGPEPDVLRVLSEEPKPRDRREELRLQRQDELLHYEAKCRAMERMARRIVRHVVFHGCAPLLILTLLALMGIVMVLGAFR